MSEHELDQGVPSASGPVFLSGRGPGRYIAAGIVGGGVVGAALGLVEPLAALVAAGGQTALGDLAALLAEGLTVLPPAFALAGLLCGAILWFILRLVAGARRRMSVVLRTAALLLALSYALYWAFYGPAQVKLAVAIGLVVLALAGGALAYAGLAALLHPILSGRRSRSVLAAGVVAALLWAGGLAGFLSQRGRAPLALSVEPTRADRPNIVLVVLDTVRADHLSCYGYHRPTTPHIDRFAAGARLYRHAVSPASWTAPSHASFFTGLPVSAHGCHQYHEFLDGEFDVLAEQLHEAGYQTVGLSSNPVVSAKRGFAQGFETYWTPATHRFRPRQGLGRAHALSGRILRLLGLERRAELAEVMHARLARWFAGDYTPDAPVFLFLNYLEPHAPYVPPSHRLEWASEPVLRKWLERDQFDALHAHTCGVDALSGEDISELEALYDDEIRFVDAKVGELLDFFGRNALDRDALIIVTSDHGEHFGEHHRMTHLFSLYQPLVHVPLIVRLGDRLAPGVDESPVQSHDVFPTMLEVAGVEWTRAPAHNCRSLLAEPEEPTRLGVSEYLAPHVGVLERVRNLHPAHDLSGVPTRLRAARRGASKVIRNGRGELELYDLDADPLEGNDLAAERREEATELERLLDRWLESFVHYESAADAPEAEALTGDELDALRDLGYAF
ncbi:MAG: sulfatase [Candidatus Brocadiia bacterium]